MRRTLICIMLLLVVCASIFSAVDEDSGKIERIFCELSEHLVFDLSKTNWLPKYRTWWDQKPANAEIGTYSNDSWIGRLGCAMTGHDIIFEVDTDGKFVSQSDPTKYRNFYIVLRPRARYDGSPITKFYSQGNDNHYQLGSGETLINLDDRLPNTRDTGHVSYQVRGITEDDNYRLIDSNGTMRYVSRFFFDVLLCMDELTVEDKQHLASANDYVAVFDVSWRCAEPGCTDPAHFGSARQIRHGYYDSSAASGETTMNMYVLPTANSLSLNLLDLIRTQGEEKIADLNVYTSNKKNMDPAKRLFVFASASPNYNSSNNTGFQLVRKNGSEEIPFKLIVKNTDGTVNREFDGKGKYTNANKQDECLNLSSGSQRTLGRTLDVTYSVVFNSEVFISFNGMVDSQAIYPDGVYESTIYYHIIFTDRDLK